MKIKGIPTFAFILFSFNLFVVLPFIKLQTSLDPGLAMRFLLCSCLLGLFSILWVLRPAQPVFISRQFLLFLGLLLCSLAWMAVSGFQSINSGDALWEFIRISILFLFCISFIMLFKNIDNVVEVLGIFSFVSIIIFSFYGSLQLITALNSAELSHTKFQVNLFIGSSLGNKNFFAEVMVMLIPLQAMNIFRQKGTRKIIFMLGLLLCLVWIILLQSFASWLALIFAGIIAVIYTGIYKFVGRSSAPSSGERKRYFLGAILLFAFLISTFLYSGSRGIQTIKNKTGLFTQYINHPELIDSTTTINDNSVFERILSWRNSIRMIEDHPLLGAGLNNWKLLQAQYGMGGTPFINTGMVHFEHPHNDYLLILAEQGPIGLLLYIAFFLFLLHTIKISIAHAKDAETRNAMLWLAFGILSFAVLSSFAYPRSRMYVMLVLMLYAALVFVLSPNPGKTISMNKNWRISIGLICLLISSLGIFAAWARFNGEIHTQEMLRAQYAKNYDRMLREANKAESYMYAMDLTGTPMSWYMGMAYFYSGKINDALSFYESAEKVNPYHLRVLNDLATSYEQSGRADKAIEKYRKGLTVAPNFIEGLLNLSATYFNTGQIDSAYAVVRKIRAVNLSVKDAQNYKLFLNAILLAKARSHLGSQYADETLERKMIFLEQDLNLEDLYLKSQKAGHTFEEELDQTLASMSKKL